MYVPIYSNGGGTPQTLVTRGMDMSRSMELPRSLDGPRTLDMSRTVDLNRGGMDVSRALDMSRNIELTRSSEMGRSMELFRSSEMTRSMEIMPPQNSTSYQVKNGVFAGLPSTPETMLSSSPSVENPSASAPLARPYNTEIPASPPHYSYVMTPPPTPSYQPALTPRDMVNQHHTWTASKRSITPPPAVSPPPVMAGAAVDQADKDEWVSISTANMSPFTILRIKALIELSGISEDYPYSVRTVNADPNDVKSSLLRSKKNTPVEYADDHVPAQWWITQLNSLISTSRPLNRQENLSKINKRLEQEKQQLGISNEPTGSHKLTFNPGAALICFDPKEKPRRIKENHRKHFQEFMEQQQQQRPPD